MPPTADRRLPEAVIFDFDGVILDSARMKTNAYFDLYELREPDRQARMRGMVWRNGGLSRVEMIAVLERDFFGRATGGDGVMELARRYADIVDRKVKDCPLIAGAEGLLERLRGTPCHLVSGTPHATLLDTVRAKGLEGWFASVTGSPSVKADVFASIVAAGGHDAARTLAVGDSLTELEAARRHGIAFVGVVPADDPNPFPADVPVVRDMDELARRF